MFHHRMWSKDRTPLFRDAVEAMALWRIVADAFPELIALCLMIDHVHLLLPHDDPGGRLAQAESAYARWRNHHRGELGPVFATHPPVKPVAPRDADRVIRYVLLNPCRRGLVADPLAWPWSTHRDRVGFSLFPVGPVERDPDRFHRYVSSDRTVDVHGTRLPVVRTGKPRWTTVLDTVSAISRKLPPELRIRGPARRLVVQTAWVHGLRDVAALAAGVGASWASIYEMVREVPVLGEAFGDRVLDAAARAVGDPRFEPWPRRG